MESVILLATVKVNNLNITKAVRFDKSVTVKEALQNIATKCSLEETEEELTSSYVLYVPPNETRDGKYLTQQNAPLLSSVYFSERDEIHVRKVFSLPICKGDGTEMNYNVDLEQTGSTLFTELCKQFFYTSSQWEMYKKNSSEDKESSVDLARKLCEQGLNANSSIILKNKKQSKKSIFQKKPSSNAVSATISGPMFVKHNTDESVLLDSHLQSGQRIFGQPISKAIKRGDGLPDREIPSIISASIEFISENAMEVMGLFRISAKSELVDELKEKFDNSVVEVSFEQDEDPHLVCSIFKQYLRDLPEPVIPFRYYNDFLALFEIHETDGESMKNDLIPLVHSLPSENFTLLKTLCLFLNSITKHEEVNKMNAKNLSTVFGPNLLRFPDDSNIEIIMRDAHRLSAVTSAMISYAEEIFTEEPQTSLQKLPTVGFVRALCSYTPDSTCECEIAFSRSDIILVFAKQHSGWWVGSVLGSNVAGFFPSNFCSPLLSSLSEVKEFVLPNLLEEKAESEVKDVSQNEPSQAEEIKPIDTETEIEKLKKQLAEQKRIAEEEARKRIEMEVYFRTQLDKFSSLFDLRAKCQ